MYCMCCGAQIPEGKRNCPNCGKKVPSHPIKDAITFIKRLALVIISRVKSNNKRAIIALAVIDVVLVMICIAIFGSGPKPQQLAQKYATAQYQSGIIETTKYSVVDGKEIVSESFKVYCEEEDISKKEGLKRLQNKYQKMFDDAKINNKVTVKRFNDIFEIRKDYKQELNLKKYGKYEIKVDIEECKKLKTGELKEKLTYFEERLETEIADTYNSVEDYIKLDKIKEGYAVKVKTQIKGKNNSQNFKNTYVVVKYKGDYKVLAYD